MTKEQYEIEAAKRMNPAFVENVNVPMLLNEAALVCFLEKDLGSEFSRETARRLSELRTKGWIDWDEDQNQEKVNQAL